MVIIPTEKRFDWQHAPVVLFSIVLLNVLLYFFYQVNDDKKIFEALEVYSQKNYVTLEWPLFRDFIRQQEGGETTTIAQSNGDSTELQNYRITNRCMTIMRLNP